MRELMLTRINQIFLCLALGVIITVGDIAIEQNRLTQETREEGPLGTTFVVNPTLLPFVTEYKAILAMHGIDINWYKYQLVRISMNPNIPDRVLGVAWGMDVDNAVVVEINQRQWNILSHEQRRLLVFHELTHDVFNVHHFDTRIMNTPLPRVVSKSYVDGAMLELTEYLNGTTFVGPKNKQCYE